MNTSPRFRTAHSRDTAYPVARTGTFDRGSVVYVLGRLLSQVMEFLLWVVAARTMSLAAAGALAIVILASRYAGFVADWGANFTGARDVAQCGHTSAHIDILMRRRELVTLCVTAAFVAGLILIDRPHFVPLAGLILFRGLNRDWLALGMGRRIKAAVPNLTGQALSLFLGLTMTAELLPIAYGLGGLVGLVTSLALNRRPTVSIAKNSTNPAGWYVIAGLAGLVYTTIDTFMLGIYRSSEEVAVYATVYRIVNAWLLLVGLTIAAAVPQIASLLAATPHRRPQIRLTLSKLAVACTAAVLAATPLVLWISPRLFGSDFDVGRDPLSILMVAAAVTTLGAPFQVLVIVDGADRSSAGVMVASAIINVIANLAAIPAYGMVGAAITTLVSQAIPAIFYWSSSRRNPA